MKITHVRDVSKVLKSLLIPAFFDMKQAADALFAAQIVHVCELWISAGWHIVVFHVERTHIRGVSAFG